MARYARWAELLAGGSFPAGDPTWQYPPGAAGLLVLPELVAPQHYAVGLRALFLLADAVVMAVLIARARRGASLAGAWFWVAALPALGRIVFSRFDIVPTALTVAALAISGRPWLAGVLLGTGAAIKLWPALLIGATTGRRRVLGGVVATLIAMLALLLGLGELGPGLDFLANQRDRGLQIEALAATPYMLARAAGVDGIHIVRRFGAVEVTGPGVSAVVTATTLATLAILVTYALAAWRRPGDLPLAMAALLAVMLVARVLSPQYLIWVLGIGALVVAERLPRAGVLGSLLLAAAGLSQLIYPFGYFRLRNADLTAALVLLSRNSLLVAALVIVAATSHVRGASRPRERGG